MKLGHNDYEHQGIEPSGEVGTDFQNDEYEGRVELLHKPVWGFRGPSGCRSATRTSKRSAKRP